MNFPFVPSSWLEELSAWWWWKNISSVIYFVLCHSECSTQAFIWTLPALKTPMSHFIVALTESSANLWKCAIVLPHSFPHPKIYWQFVISLLTMKIVSAEYKFWSVHHADYNGRPAHGHCLWFCWILHWIQV